MPIVQIIVVGLIVGAVARFLVPGRDPMGILGTLAIGAGGALLGWWIGRAVVGGKVGLHPWLWAVGGAVLLVLARRSISGRRWLGRRRWGW